MAILKAVDLGEEILGQLLVEVLDADFLVVDVLIQVGDQAGGDILGSLGGIVEDDVGAYAVDHSGVDIAGEALGGLLLDFNGVLILGGVEVGGGLYQILVLSIGEGFPEANGGLLIRGGNADDAQQHYKSQQGGENRTHFHTHVLHIPNVFVLM